MITNSKSKDEKKSELKESDTLNWFIMTHGFLWLHTLQVGYMAKQMILLSARKLA